MIQRFDWPDFLPRFAEAAEAHGFTRIPFGKTAAGELIAWEKPGPGAPYYLSAGIHGDEPAGPLALLELMRTGAFHDDHHWLLCPALNPTGLAANTRTNSQGEDLNRDYWNRRTIEVHAHAGWLETVPVPRCLISLHEDWESSGFYFYEINCGTDRPERAHAILDAAGPWFPPEPNSVIDDHDVREPGWIYHASEADLPELWPEAIYLAKRGCPLSFTFETPSSSALARRVSAHVAAVNAVIRS